MKLKYKCEELERMYKDAGMKERGDYYESLLKNPIKMYLSYFKINYDYEISRPWHQKVKSQSEQIEKMIAAEFKVPEKAAEPKKPKPRKERRRKRR